MKKIISINIEEETIEALKERAKRERRSFSNLIDHILKQDIPKEERRKKSIEV